MPFFTTGTATGLICVTGGSFTSSCQVKFDAGAVRVSLKSRSCLVQALFISSSVILLIALIN